MGGRGMDVQLAELAPKGEMLLLPQLYQAGIWTALVIGIGFTSVYAWRIASESARMSAGLAATHPLNRPTGLAVSWKGNLYVGHQGGNQILVYSTTFSQSAGKNGYTGS